MNKFRVLICATFTTMFHPVRDYVLNTEHYIKHKIYIITYICMYAALYDENYDNMMTDLHDGH